jgi:ribosomal-protein-alanine N-acetyltransferase
MLWPAALDQLESQGGGTAAAIVTQPWLEPILLENGFQTLDHIVLMELNTQTANLPAAPAGCVIRPMLPDDLPRVADLDAAAFEPLWRNSLEALASALKQASYASVAEASSGLLGYQLSTGGVFGTHLARLAVVPTARGHGLGGALIKDLVAHIPVEREPRLTVNTQSSNAASHALYSRLGFRRTGERFPVYLFEVPGARAAKPNHGGWM